MKVVNPYLEEYEKYKNYDDLLSGEFPIGKTPRGVLVYKYSFAVPNQEALDIIASFSPIVEIGAGGGYWASLLRKMGVAIKAFDDFSDKGKRKQRNWTEVKQGDEKVIDNFPDHALFICWPYCAGHFLERYKGETVIYIGEPAYGCCAEPEFFEELDKKFKLVKEVEIPKWNDIGDTMLVYRR